MKRMNQILSGVVFAAALIAAGCQSDGSTGNASALTHDHAAGVACDKCKTTWVTTKYQSGTPGSKTPVITGYRDVAQHECPDCRNMATTMLQQGKSLVPGQTVHSCKACGGEMKVCHTDS
jgi:hypothetical protein